jgi:hypothetical protein
LATKYINLEFFLKIWSSYGYWKITKNHMILALFIFILFLYLFYIARKNGWLRRMITCDNGCGTRAPVPWWVSVRWLAGRQAGAAGVCLSVLPCECTNNARDCCDEAAVLQFSLRSFLLPICCFWESVASPPCTDKKRFGRVFFFLLLSVWWFCGKQGRPEHRMHVFFSLPPAPLSLHACLDIDIIITAGICLFV